MTMRQSPEKVSGDSVAPGRVAEVGVDRDLGGAWVAQRDQVDLLGGAGLRRGDDVAAREPALRWGRTAHPSP